jgi:hypothetical protein
MSSTVLDMSMSLDGYIAGPNESPDNGLGDGGDRLHEWFFPGAEGDDFAAALGRLRGVNRQIYDELMATGAVVAGRGPSNPRAAGEATITAECPFTSSAATRHPPGRPTGHWFTT